MSSFNFNQKMSSFNFSDFTVAGTYVSAIKAAHDSDRRHANRHFGPSESPSRPRFLSDLVRRILAADTERRSVDLRVSSRRA
jgi:hypothetical protein